MTIINFPGEAGAAVPAKPDRVMWTCRCGCATFYLLEGNDAECAMCGTLVTDPDALGWRTAEPPPTPSEPVMEKIVRTIIDFNDPAANLRSCLKFATVADAAVVIVVSRTEWGHDLHTYRSDWMDTPEQLEQLDDWLARSRAIIIENGKQRDA